MRTFCLPHFIFLLLFGFGEGRRKWSLTDARRKLYALVAGPAGKHATPKIHHLVVLQHGLGGNASDWSFFAETLQKLNTGSQWMQFDWNSQSKRINQTKRTLHQPSTSQGNIQVTFWAPTYNSHEGIEVVGRRLADDIWKKHEEYTKKGETLKYLSAVGHSMGGLFLRYAIKSLYERGAIITDESSSWLPSVKIELCNFFTVATPHLSVWRPADSPTGFLFNLITHAISERSTKQVSLNDARFRIGTNSSSWRQPLLYRMATEDVFIKSLSSFKRGVLYSNVFGDTQVWYESGAITSHNPYKGRGSRELKKRAPYPHIADIGCGRYNDSEVQRPYWSRKHTGRLGTAVGQIYRNLNSITFGDAGWERCDVNIDGSLAMHFNHWLILGIEKGVWKVEDPAMHIMSNLILGDTTIKNSRYRFEVVLEGIKALEEAADRFG